MLVKVADVACAAILERDFNMSIPWYLMAGYLYEVHDEALLSDGFWDHLIPDMTASWEWMHHFHKPLVPYDMGSEGTMEVSKTASAIDMDGLPSRVIFAARYALHQYTGRVAW